MLLTAHVPQGLKAPDAASPTSNYSLTFVQHDPAAPISPRPRAVSERGPRRDPRVSFTHSAVIPLHLHRQRRAIRHWLLTGGQMNEWTDGRMTGGLFKWDSTAGWRRQRSLVKEINRHTLSPFIQTGYWGFTRHFSTNKTIQIFAKHLRILHDLKLHTVTYK